MINEEPNDESKRALVTVQRVAKIDPIAGKDLIELAHLGVEGGWRSVVKKGSVRVGTLVAFHEPDSFVPVKGPNARACYAFLEKDAKECPDESAPNQCDGCLSEVPVENGIHVVPYPSGSMACTRSLYAAARARIRTKSFNAKNGKIYSQGLVVLMNETGLDLNAKNFREGDDLTELLGVTHYEVAASKTPGAGIKGPADPRLFPWPALPGVSKTDETRLQSCRSLLLEMHAVPVAVTYKIDGQSMTVARNFDESTVVATRNREHRIVENLPPTDAHAHILSLGVLDKLPPGYCVQGELAGPGIQGNKAGFPNVRLFVFNVFRRWNDESEFEELDFKAARGFCADQKLTFVPVVQAGWLLETKEPLDSAIRAAEAVDEPAPTEPRHSVRTFVEMATSQRYPNGHPAEGIVVRPMVPMTSERLKGARLSAKIISPAWEEKS